MANYERALEHHHKDLEIAKQQWGDFIRPKWLSADGLVQDCNNSSALAMELLQSCTKPLNCHFKKIAQILKISFSKLFYLDEYLIIYSIFLISIQL